MNSYDRQQPFRAKRHEFHAEEHTAERITNSVRRSTPRSASRFQCVTISAHGGEHRGARHDFVRYHSLVTFCSSVFIRVERAARRSTLRSASRRRSLRPQNRRLSNIAGSRSLWQRGITLSKGALLGSHHQVTTMRTASRLRTVHH